MADLVQPRSQEEKLLQGLDPKRMPKHVAIIMDGNGRWAQSRGLSRLEGHRKGAATARLIVEACARMSIPILTLYTFSSENWKRPPREINALMNMLYENLEQKAELLKRHRIRMRMIGEPTRLPARLGRKIKETEEMSRDFTDMTVNLAINYGGRQEILQAVRSMIKAGVNAESVSDETLRQYLYTQNDPDPDLVIRTSGEQRLSNFLVYQSAYAELIFARELWPDFLMGPLLRSLTEFQSRQRRFGGI
ncbi:MAG TPA: di-trans,poly-cis-decaprenylcistransferase [Candidatus Aminicenantes bacterium]|nr:di-trans,poly-cis-decaprenylcistransferase [Candidatus Aminicenantes bacterium]